MAIALLFVPSPQLSAQQGSFDRLVRLTVTDPLNRFVTGLNANDFEVIENGTRRPVTLFASVDDPIAVAVVSEAPLADLDTLRVPGELFQTRSLSDAIRQLVASDKPRKALIITGAVESGTLPGGIFMMKADVTMARKTIVEAYNQYAVGFMSLDPSATIEIVLKQPRGLPSLKANIWK